MNLRPSRSVAALAVALLVLGHLQVSVHTSQVRHVICAEHGELVEAPELAGTIDGERRLVEVTLGVDDDEHCPAAAGLRPHIVSNVVLAQIALLDTPPVASPPIAITRATALSGYRIAPKTSPPALALTV